ncbi:FAD/NAD(P)-binding protein [Domibacillus sp. PGB-M46]|uniref:FAD/NAD(P)-binding protein n=1 Tax=Domibacillus sp. PGB-M46 TaxID=2910255 RepID=UPI001F5652A7|nr:FAD/NAD(P)-binding protein [Domibacillus sp. PGB-M46]MCI2256421.1 FAD/NAD(P)-binding protein [Domibacillus sp. PGB-M46]
MFKWIIVGGGIQGVTMASFLLKENKASVRELAIVDPHQKPLQNWKRCTKLISMPYLRSPVVHHLDVHPFSLQSFAKSSVMDESTAFYGRFKRPALSLFNEHCTHLIQDTGLKESWIQGCVKKLERFQNYWQLELQGGRKLAGENIVLAVGVSEQLVWPDWAKEVKKQPDVPVYHIFNSTLPAFEQMKRPFTIIGGGITSVHLALKLSSMFPGEVILLKRHSFRLHDFDSDPAWLGPKNQMSFRKTACYQKRREQIKQARHKGSLPRDLYMKMRRSIRDEKLIAVDGEVYGASMKKGRVVLENEQGCVIHQTGTVLLATGFDPSLPEKHWLEPVIKKLNLSCAACGYPIVSSSLQWGPGLYVVGALAELEIGPIARNISGARQAAERIIQSL